MRAAKLFGSDFVAKRLLELIADNLNEVGAEFDVLVVFLDGSFDVVDLGEGCITGAVLGTSAEEVPVLIAVPVDGALLDEPPVDVSFQSAVSAPQAPLQVVGVDASAFTGDGSRLEHALHDIEEIRLNQRRMTPLEHFVLVRHFADVVAVSEHRLDLAV